MKDEIKEILDNLKFTNNDVMWCDKITLNVEQSHLLLDYITNLQTIEQQYSAILSENAELENKITNLQEEINKLTAESTEWEERTYCWQDRAENLEIIIDKAIKYIMTELITEWDIKNDGYVSGSDLPVDAITPLLNILNGDDE